MEKKHLVEALVALGLAAVFLLLAGVLAHNKAMGSSAEPPSAEPAQWAPEGTSRVLVI